jgi:hypothetical protein
MINTKLFTQLSFLCTVSCHQGTEPIPGVLSYSAIWYQIRQLFWRLPCQSEDGCRGWNLGLSRDKYRSHIVPGGTSAPLDRCFNRWQTRRLTWGPDCSKTGSISWLDSFASVEPGSRARAELAGPESEVRPWWLGPELGLVFERWRDLRSERRRTLSGSWGSS